MTLLGTSTRTDSFGALSVAEGAVTVDLDASLLIHLALFVVLLLVLKPTLFDPMLKLFEEREKRIEGTRHQATKVDKRSAKALEEYEKRMTEAREEGSRERDALLSEGQKREADLMSAVRAEIEKTLDTGRAATRQEAHAARQQLRSDARGLGREIASSVLGREVAS